jgi:predicted CoA-substrate-specific enzyme activase
LEICREILEDVKYDTITATGYGRNLFRNYYDCHVITEIKAFAIGVRKVYPECRTILDIGGQDTKAISLNDTGGIGKFEMNDKCAAGTGKFLEIMATALGFTLQEFIEAGLSAEKSAAINNMCTVFAESEVISMVAQGHNRAAIAKGIHETICRRSVAMLKKVDIIGKVAFVGGVAMNSCFSNILRQEIGPDLFIPEDPQTVGALGCAYMKTTKES